jgi:hypothetical protein
MSEMEISPISYWIISYNDYFYSNIEAVVSFVSNTL